jgi:integrase
MLEAGVPLIYIRNFLGHESVKTTEVYARVSQAGLVKALTEHSVKSNIPTSKVSHTTDDNRPDFLKKYL